MSKVLEANLMEELDEIQKTLKPSTSMLFATMLCDCTGQCYGDCQGDCLNTTEGDENTTCYIYFD